MSERASEDESSGVACACEINHQSDLPTYHTLQHAPTVEFLLPPSIFSVVNGTFGSISNLQQGLGIIDCSLIAVSVEVSTAKRL